MKKMLTEVWLDGVLFVYGITENVWPMPTTRLLRPSKAETLQSGGVRGPSIAADSDTRAIYSHILYHTYILCPLRIISKRRGLSPMTAKTLSPTGRILRTSRLFSLPTPLPRPDAKIATARLGSDTATLPYPTHAAIETSLSCFPNGDWGLKRSLPRRFGTKTTTPMIRIGDIDTIDSIAEFESAADHTITLRKWQEMNVPISVALPPRTAIDGGSLREAKKSVFETPLDNTERGDEGTNNGRWKFKGPWLASKSEGEFQKYVQKSIRRQKTAFREFLCSKLQAMQMGDRKRIAMESGEDFDQEPGEVSEGDLEDFIRQLRKDRIGLHQLIEKFLDLPNYQELSVETPSGSTTKENVFLEHGPSQTHPSAGLSYLRTASHIYNHPIFGPQEVEPPVQGRVLKPQNVPRTRQKRALIGVAGVVADDDRGPSIHAKVGPRGLTDLDPDIPDGTKIWYNIDHASIDSRGRLDLLIRRTEDDALAIHKGIEPQDEEKIDESKILGGDRQFPSSSSSPPAASREISKKGYGLEGTNNESSSGGAMPTGDASHEDIMGLLRAGQNQPLV